MIGMALTALLFVFPGAIFLWKKNFFPRLALVEKLPLIMALSLSYWIISFWLLLYIQIPLHVLVYGSLTLSLVVWLIMLYRQHKTIRITLKNVRANVLPALWFVILAIPAILVINRNIAPSGADMSMHSYVTKVIYLHDGFPKTLRPLVPLDQFGNYPIGFPTIVADMMMVNHLPVYTNALLLTAFTYWLFALTIYTLLRRQFPFAVSAVTTVLVAWGSITPNDIIEWGANPTVLSLNLLILAFLLQRPWSMVATIIAAYLTHYMLPVALFYLPLLFMAPTLLSFSHAHLSISEATLSYVRGLQLQELLEWNGIGNPLLFIQNTLGKPFFFLYLASCIFLVFRRSKSIWVQAIFLGGVTLMILNAQHWWLPLAAVLYPKRVVLLTLLPAAFAIAQTLVWLAKKRKALVVIIACLTLIFHRRIFTSFQNFVNSGRFSTVTQEDVVAMDWLATHTTDEDVILNNYNDAGLWIPAIANRQITTYHTNPIDMDNLGINRGRETYAYIGNKAMVEWGPSAASEKIVSHPESFEQVFAVGGVKIYKILGAK